MKWSSVKILDANTPDNYVAMRLDDACVIDRKYRPNEASMIVNNNWQSTVGISEIVSALHRGEEIITTELQRNDLGSATLVKKIS